MILCCTYEILIRMLMYVGLMILLIVLRVDIDQEHLSENHLLV